MRRYSVLLLVPDYAADTFGHDVFYTYVTGGSPREAIAAAQRKAVDTHAYKDAQPGDFHPLLVTLGHHDPENLP